MLIKQTTSIRIIFFLSTTTLHTPKTNNNLYPLILQFNIFVLFNAGQHIVFSGYWSSFPRPGRFCIFIMVPRTPCFPIHRNSSHSLYAWIKQYGSPMQTSFATMRRWADTVTHGNILGAQYRYNQSGFIEKSIATGKKRVGTSLITSNASTTQSAAMPRSAAWLR